MAKLGLLAQKGYRSIVTIQVKMRGEMMAPNSQGPQNRKNFLLIRRLLAFQGGELGGVVGDDTPLSVLHLLKDCSGGECRGIGGDYEGSGF